MLPATACRTLGGLGDSKSDAMEPASNGVAFSDGGRLSREDNEGGLEGVLCILVVAQHSSTYSPDTPTVTPDQTCKSGLVTGGGEPLQEFGIGQFGKGQPPDMAKNGSGRCVGHTHDFPTKGRFIDSCRPQAGLTC